ncbi:vanadium-dependent haloperoxidase [Hymenobacter sp. UYCo722]|uniref:vanadium-dependent haloperoxidase n=1 Tax=Hymenobacter sp. UYCo722 TaxID=3156335 RepID=UPI003394298B
MKTTFLHLSRRPATWLRSVGLGAGLLLGACHSTSDPSPSLDPSPATSTYRADVAVGWLALQLRLTRLTPVTPANTFARPFGYTGIAGYEAAVPGMANHRSLAGQLNGLTGLPTADKTLVYSWALSANAALAASNRNFFANTSPALLATIDSLEAANRITYSAGISTEASTRSIAFGQQVATAVLDWARADGFAVAGAAYTPPTGPGLWAPTAPANAPAVLPYWGNNRLLVAGSGEGSDPGPPPAYSTVAGSPFQAMAQEVYDISQTRTPEQTAIALFWNDVPNGRSFTPPGHWVSILQQVLVKENPALDRALLAYAKLGISLSDALVTTFKMKYTYNVLRPITYIRGAMGQPGWLSLIPAPAFPEYSAGHGVVSGAAAETMTELFGATYAFTDQGYVPFGIAARSFMSFEQAGVEAGISRVYGGIHFRPTIDKSLIQGKKIAQNLDARLKFE